MYPSIQNQYPVAASYSILCPQDYSATALSTEPWLQRMCGSRQCLWRSSCLCYSPWSSTLPCMLQPSSQSACPWLSLLYCNTSDAHWGNARLTSIVCHMQFNFVVRSREVQYDSSWLHTCTHKHNSLIFPVSFPGHAWKWSCTLTRISCVLIWNVSRDLQHA